MAAIHQVDFGSALVHRINTLGTNVLTTGVSPVSEEDERRRVRERLASRGKGGGL